MRIVSVREQTVPVGGNVHNAVVNFARMTTSIVAVVTDVVRAGHPVVGYGFSSLGRYAPTSTIRDRMIPRLLEAKPSELLRDDGSNLDPARVMAILLRDEKPGGHGERAHAIGAIDMAVWDAVAKVEDEPLWFLLGKEHVRGRVSDRVPVLAVAFSRPGMTVSDLQDEIRRFIANGHRRVKIKIGSGTLGDDLRRIEGAVAALGDGHSLAVDANGRFDAQTLFAYADALSPYGLLWFEEPCDPLDFQLHSDAVARYGAPIATGENLFSRSDARNLLRHAGLRPGLDILQFDPALAYGLVEYLAILDESRQHGWTPQRCWPHGGSLVTLHLVAGLGLGGSEVWPPSFAPLAQFGDDEGVDDGSVRVPDAPGIGFETNTAARRMLHDLAA
jgi:D(-)-tartrate dehydratase